MPILNPHENSSIDTIKDYIYYGGQVDYNDNATSTTPISVPNTNTYVYLTNDGAGTYTNKLHSPFNVTPEIWDTTNNEFNFTGLKLGDVVEIRLDLQITTTAPNQFVDIDLELGIGGGSYDILFGKTVFKTAGVQDFNRYNTVYMGDTNTLNNPAKFKIRSEDTATVVVRGWALVVTQRGI